MLDRFRTWANLRYWERRGRRHGQRAVFHLGHTVDELDAVTARQREVLFPVLREQLRGNEAIALDFGCGTGRFTSDLARLINGRAIGVDPTQTLLDLAPAAPGVEYQRLRQGRVPIPDASVDLVFVCLVLGAITDRSALARACSEINRVLRPDGLLFLVENTTDLPRARQIVFRSIEEYARSFPSIQLHQLTDYDDLGERISVMAGRKNSA